MSRHFELYKMVVKGYIKSFKENDKNQQDSPVDFVVTWVDGNDPEWLEQKLKYQGKGVSELNGNGVCRYRDWESFLYWFRAVEKFAPWVRYVHLVTCGHVPRWINKECPKLKIVNHKDFIPDEYLPTFNCNTIELNLFRIPELSENFVYFNDDVFLCRPVTKEDFFVDSKPKHTAIAIPHVNRDNEIPYHLFFNTYGIINRKNNINNIIEQRPEKWFSHLYGSGIKHNMIAWQNSGLAGMFFTHMGTPFCKSTMEKTWNKYEKSCIETCEYKFRNIHQITHQVFSIEDIISGNFIPSEDNWGTNIMFDDTDGIFAAYKNQTKKMICLFDRDNYTEEEINNININLRAVFDKFLPDKSMFER